MCLQNFSCNPALAVGRFKVYCCKVQHYLILFVQVKHPFNSPSRLITEPLWLEDFDFFAAVEDFLLEVEGGAQVVLEDAVVVGALHFFLRLVEWKVAEVLGLVGSDSKLDDLLVNALVGDDAKTSVEVLFCVPVFWHLERVVGD